MLVVDYIRLRILMELWQHNQMRIASEVSRLCVVLARGAGKGKMR